MTQNKFPNQPTAGRFWSIKTLIISLLLQFLSRFLVIFLVIITPPLSTAAINTADSIFSLATCVNAVTIFIITFIVARSFRDRLPTIKQQIIHAIIPTLLVGILATGIYFSLQALLVTMCRLLLWVLTSIVASALVAARYNRKKIDY